MHLKDPPLRNLCDDRLLAQTGSLVREERELLTRLLHYFREIDRRRLYSQLKYKSFFHFLVAHYHYSEDQAYRRISAMRLLTEMPEVAEKITSGALSLSHLDLAQKHFRREEKSPAGKLDHAQKLEVFELIAEKPLREAEREILSLSSSPVMERPEKRTALTAEKSELRLTLANSTLEKIERIKAMRAHATPRISTAELVDQLCDLALTQWDKSATPQKRRGKSGSATKPMGKADLRRFVFRRAENRCENCSSIFATEIDHVQLRAFGGSDSVENLRVLCRSCNQRSAIVNLGIAKMSPYLESTE